MLYFVSWTYDGEARRGFLKAKDETEARSILKTLLKPGCVIKRITEAFEHQITPQSLTLNFANTTDYTLFG